jgi:hypothetical protein
VGFEGWAWVLEVDDSGCVVMIGRGGAITGAEPEVCVIDIMGGVVHRYGVMMSGEVDGSGMMTGARYVSAWGLDGIHRKARPKPGCN